MICIHHARCRGLKNCYCETLTETPLYRKVEQHISAYAKEYDSEYGAITPKLEAEWKKAAEKDAAYIRDKSNHKFKERIGQVCKGCDYCNGVTI